MSKFKQYSFDGIDNYIINVPEDINTIDDLISLLEEVKKELGGDAKIKVDDKKINAFSLDAVNRVFSIYHNQFYGK